MRSAVLAAVLLAACTMPSGTAIAECDASWRDVDAAIVQPRTGETETLPIECIRRVDQNRVRIGFVMPAGPTCYALSAVDVVEAADAVSITLRVTEIADPAAGACADGAVRTATEVDLQAPVAGRMVLDGSGS